MRNRQRKRNNRPYTVAAIRSDPHPMTKLKTRPDRNRSKPKELKAIQPGRLPMIAGIAAIAVAITLAAVLRFWASLDDFWLDEIWSWFMAMQLKSPLDVILRVHHDNNHHLNTFVLYALGNNAPLYLYRLPAVVAGIGTVLLCGLVARHWSRVAAATATLITGCSFLLIQFSSEARGYAYVLFFAMASFAVIQESLERPRIIWDVLFACFAVLGFLSHLTYAFAYIALVVWSLWRRISVYGWQSRQHISPLVFEVLIPAAFVVFWYLVDLRFVQVGGGDENPVWKVLAQAISAAFGGPLEGQATVWIAIAVAATAIAALFLLYRSGSDLWIPLSIGIFAIPAVILLVVRPQSPYPRYFLVSMLFLQLLISWFLGWIYQRPYGKVAYLLILAAILGGNAFLTVRLLKYGRGDYQAAVHYMLEQTSGQQVLVASDHDFRNKMMLAFYFSRAGAADRANYFDFGQWPPEGPEWVVFHNFAQEFTPYKSIKDGRGNTYELARVFPYAGLSGFNWVLYHNTSRPTNPPPAPGSQGPEKSPPGQGT